MEKNKNEKVLTSFVMPANLWPLIKALPTARSQWLALMAINTYGYEGIITDTEDAPANAVLASAIIQIDAMRGREQRLERGTKDATAKGGRRGNPNFTKGRTNPYYRDNSRSQLSLFNGLKHNKLNKDNSKIIQRDNNLSVNELYKDNSEIIRDNSGDNSTPCNELKYNKLDNDNSPIRKKEKKEEILSNTSHLTELVLDNNPDNNPECKSDETPAPAPCNGRAGVSPLTSENRNGGESTPIPPSANSHSLQTPPPPTPAPVCGGKYEPREGDDEVTRNIRAQCKAEVEQIEAGFVAKERGGEPPKGMSRIRANDILHDDSKEAEIERERVRLPKLVKLAEEEADPAQKAQILEMAKGIKTKIANYESTKKQTDGNERAEQVRV